MANSSFLEDFKSKVTYESKTTYAAAMIILGFLVWGITHEYSGLFTILLIMIPSILLVIPNESIRNNRILGIILAILVIFMILMCIVNILTAGNAYNYYYSIWLANQKAKEEEAAIVKRQTDLVSIGRPAKPRILKKLFNSVDKDEITNE